MNYWRRMDSCPKTHTILVAIPYSDDPIHYKIEEVMWVGRFSEESLGRCWLGHNGTSYDELDPVAWMEIPAFEGVYMGDYGED